MLLAREDYQKKLAQYIQFLREIHTIKKVRISIQLDLLYNSQGLLIVIFLLLISFEICIYLLFSVLDDDFAKGS